MSPGSGSLPGPAAGASDRPPVRVMFDGACQLTPRGRIAAFGFVVSGPAHSREECGLAVAPNSPRATNNVAEYVAAIRALEWLLASGYRGRVELLGDSELVVRQMKGEYQIRADHLREYYARLRQLADSFEAVAIDWVPREQNIHADALSKEGIRRALRGEPGPR